MHFTLGIPPGTLTNTACRLGTSDYVAGVRRGQPRRTFFGGTDCAERLGCEATPAWPS